MKTEWAVAYVKPRREKKVAAFCARHGIAATLPCYRAVHRYRGKTAVFQNPLFPGYVFLRVEPERKLSLRQNEHVAALLEVLDQETFERQLSDILLALEEGVELRVAPAIGEGMRVRIRSGPLQGVEGLVQERHGALTVWLRLDFISQAAAVQVEADALELV